MQRQNQLLKDVSLLFILQIFYVLLESDPKMDRTNILIEKLERFSLSLYHHISEFDLIKSRIIHGHSIISK